MLTSIDYALGDVSLDQVYGDNVARGRAIAAQYDPAKVMCLAGAWACDNLRSLAQAVLDSRLADLPILTTLACSVDQ